MTSPFKVHSSQCPPATYLQPGTRPIHTPSRVRGAYARTPRFVRGWSLGYDRDWVRPCPFERARTLRPCYSVCAQSGIKASAWIFTRPIPALCARVCVCVRSCARRSGALSEEEGRAGRRVGSGSFRNMKYANRSVQRLLIQTARHASPSQAAAGHTQDRVYR